MSAADFFKTLNALMVHEAKICQARESWEGAKQSALHGGDVIHMIDAETNYRNIVKKANVDYLAAIGEG